VWGRDPRHGRALAQSPHDAGLRPRRGPRRMTLACEDAAQPPARGDPRDRGRSRIRSARSTPRQCMHGARSPETRSRLLTRSPLAQRRSNRQTCARGCSQRRENVEIAASSHLRRRRRARTRTHGSSIMNHARSTETIRRAYRTGMRKISPAALGAPRPTSSATAAEPAGSCHHRASRRRCVRARGRRPCRCRAPSGSP